jgi:hypothetical protein
MKQRIAIEPLKHALDKFGWALLDHSAGSHISPEAELLGLAQQLGKVAGNIEHPLTVLRPRAPSESRLNTLSKKYGMGDFPLHADTSHWICPVRYVLFLGVRGCQEAPTRILDTRLISLTTAEEAIAQQSLFVFQSGARSFYSSIKDPRRPFIRFDPGCMKPVSSQARHAINLFAADRNSNCIIEINWMPSQLLVLDNWRVLHGRGVARKNSNRVLLRAYVKGEE